MAETSEARKRREGEPESVLRSRLVAVGVRYCVQHHGVANEDDSVCDFMESGAWRQVTPFPCRFRDLVYEKGAGR